MERALAKPLPHDLYYRSWNVGRCTVPSLRERADDIPFWWITSSLGFAGRMGKRVRQIEKRTFDAMQQYSWPGNIRELQNVIERGVILAEAEVFRLDPGTLRRILKEALKSAQAPGENTREQQKARIEAVLKETRGRIAGPDGAAARLGLPASTLESRIRTLKINKHLFRSNT